MWRLSLTDDDQRQLEAGPWQASSASTYRSAEEKLRAIEWRRNWVDTWLAGNRLIDPVRRQHGLEIPPIARKQFEAALFPMFGKPDGLRGELERAYGNTVRGELERAHTDQSSNAKSLQTLATPWSPPEGLSLDQVKALLGDAPRPFLSNIVDFLAFGAVLPEKVLELLCLLFDQKDRDARAATLRALSTEGYPIERIMSERRRAAAALFDGAKRAEQSVLVGSQDRHSDQPIPPHYFDVPRNLGFENNSISADLVVLVDNRRWQQQFDAEFKNKPSPWLNVRVDRKWFVGWLTKQLTRDTGIPGLLEIPSEEGSFILQGTAVSGAQHPPARPNSIGGFSISISSIGPSPSSPKKSDVVVSAKKRGKKADKFERVMREMRAALASGTLTAATLDQMLEKTLAEKYGASRDTCRRARKEVLAVRAN